jgi:hypothetical protein
MSPSPLPAGIYDFDGRGLHEPFLLDPQLTYTVPVGNEAGQTRSHARRGVTAVNCAVVRMGGAR